MIIIPDDRQPPVSAGHWASTLLAPHKPLEIAPVRTLIRDRLALPGNPQMLLQLGLAHTTHATARRPPDELIDS